MNAAWRIDVAVIGAGVIDVAVARAFARAGREVVVLEAESAIGAHTSSRNSELVHAGICRSPGLAPAMTVADTVAQKLSA
jgi:L-2-hydroxyglutarate oxidase LhgO